MQILDDMAYDMRNLQMILLIPSFGTQPVFGTHNVSVLVANDMWMATLRVQPLSAGSLR